MIKESGCLKSEGGGECAGDVVEDGQTTLTEEEERVLTGKVRVNDGVEEELVFVDEVN